MSFYENILEKQKEEAYFYARKFGLDPTTKSATDGAVDAFRHAYTSAVMARDYGDTIANITGILNEIKSDIKYNQTFEQKNMDLWNNREGREIGLEGGR